MAVSLARKTVPNRPGDSTRGRALARPLDEAGWQGLLAGDIVGLLAAGL